MFDVVWACFGFALGGAVILLGHNYGFFRWPGPGKRSSLAIFFLSLLAFSSSLFLSFPATASLVSPFFAPGFWSGIVGPVGALILRRPIPMLYGPLKKKGFFVEKGSGLDAESIRRSISVRSSRQSINIKIRSLKTGRIATFKSVGQYEKVNDSGPTSLGAFPYQHALQLSENGPHEVYLAEEPRHIEFFIRRDCIRETNGPAIGLIYPNFTWLAYNPNGYENLYSVPMGTWIDGRDPIEGNRHDIHTHQISTKIYHTISRRGHEVHALSNSDISCTTDWMNLDLLVLSGHDEFWTASLMENLREYVTSGGKVVIFSGNVGYKVLEISSSEIRFAGEWHTSDTPERDLLGAAFEFGGYGLQAKMSMDEAISAGLSEDDYRNSSGMAVIRADHPIFAGTGIRAGQWFGVRSNVNKYEIDGVPILNDLSIDGSKYGGPVTQEGVLAWSFGVGEDNIPRKFATVVESNVGQGAVLHLGSINWGNALEIDKTVRKIVLNAIEHMLKFAESH